jgi:hypothetical protein
VTDLVKIDEASCLKKNINNGNKLELRVVIDSGSAIVQDSLLKEITLPGVKSIYR